MHDKDDYNVKHIFNLIKSSFLPELKQDLDSMLINREHFEQYHKLLSIQLPLLYDLIPQNILTELPDSTELRSTLILLLCELSADKTIYQLEQINLRRQANALLERFRIYLTSGSNVESFIKKYYERKLHKECWKRNLGAIHGFHKFLEIRFKSAGVISDDSSNINSKWIPFCLSVALNIRTCHEPNFKLLGIRIFSLMLNRGEKQAIQEANIHSVIYEDVFKDVHYIDSADYINNTWRCLLRCLDYFEIIDTQSWFELDNMMEIIVRNISLVTDEELTLQTLSMIVTFCSYFSINHKEIERLAYSFYSDSTDLISLRDAACANNCHVNHRWVKNILNMLLLESQKLLLSKNTCKLLLKGMHICYIVATHSIPIALMEPHLLKFFDKFSLVLMEMLVIQQCDMDITKETQLFLETFCLQLRQTQHTQQSLDIQSFGNAFTKLLQQPLFDV